MLPPDGYIAPRADEGRQIAAPELQPARAAASGVSERQQRNLDALARRAPDKLSEVQRGEKSVHRACIEASIVKVPTALDQVKKLLPRLSGEEREELRRLLGLTPCSAPS
jgi:hypothetical protein